MIDLHRGDVVLVAFPFVHALEVRRKRRPAVVVQADRYNQRRGAVILAAITSTQTRRDLPSKVPVRKDSRDGRGAGLRTDSIIGCQTIVTIPREEIVRRIGKFPSAILQRIDQALRDALGLGSAEAGA